MVAHGHVYWRHLAKLAPQMKDKIPSQEAKSQHKLHGEEKRLRIAGIAGLPVV